MSLLASHNRTSRTSMILIECPSEGIFNPFCYLRIYGVYQPCKGNDVVANALFSIADIICDSVMVAHQSLTLRVWVQILFTKPKKKGLVYYPFAEWGLCFILFFRYICLLEQLN